MSVDLIQALRRAHGDLENELSDAEIKLTRARQAVDAVRTRYDEFKAQLPEVCAAAGLSMSDVIGELRDADAPGAARKATTATVEIMNPLALPCRPLTQRWYAGQALHQIGGEGSISDVADEMRRLGYEHSHQPNRENQLDQSLAALPSQVTWITPGAGPGRLRLKLDQ